MRGFMNLFGKSPFGPTQVHMERVLACVQQLVPLYEAACNDDPEGVLAAIAEIDRTEALADDAKNEIRNHLPKALFLPVDRRDLLEVIHCQDSIADSLQEAASVMTLRDDPLMVPVPLRQEVAEFVANVALACGHYGAIVQHLDELLETTFGGPEAERVLEMIENLDAAETKSDVLQRDIVRGLFRLENQLSPLDIILWQRVLERTGEIANNAERAGNRLRLLIAQA